MKRNLLSIMAVAVAVIAFAFAKAPTADVDLKFVGTDVTNAAQVQDIDNWVEDMDGILCAGQENKACIITANSDYLTSGTNRKFLNSVSISVVAGSAGSSVGYVPQSTTPTQASLGFTHKQ